NASLSAPGWRSLFRRRSGLRFRGAIVAVRHCVASLRLIDLEPRSASLQFIDGDGLDQVTLLRHQLIHVLQRFGSASAQTADRVTVAEVAVLRRLARAHEFLVLL